VPLYCTSILWVNTHASTWTKSNMCHTHKPMHRRAQNHKYPVIETAAQILHACLTLQSQVTTLFVYMRHINKYATYVADSSPVLDGVALTHDLVCRARWIRDILDCSFAHLASYQDFARYICRPLSGIYSTTYIVHDILCMSQKKDTFQSGLRYLHHISESIWKSAS